MCTTRALVLRIIHYGDNRLVVSLFTESRGMVTCMVRVARGRKSGGRTALWQMLNLVDVTMECRPSRDMQTIKEASLSCPWQGLPYHPMKAAISMFIGDFLFHSLRGEGENVALFAFLENSLRWFDEADEGIADFHLQLMLRLTRFLGILPGVDGYARHKVYDLRGACYATLMPGHGQYLAADEARWIPLLLRVDYGRMRKLKMTTAGRRRMMEVILLYYRLHVPAFGELQSLDILREVFA
ncbi:MAG: DNA repair protein RecO [Paraprevotella sp.]|nr:DNA repair protein RecO [Paraprevotella sp.]